MEEWRIPTSVYCSYLNRILRRELWDRFDLVDPVDSSHGQNDVLRYFCA